MSTDQIEHLRSSKPGWLARLFGIESARLIACDAVQEGDTWSRGEPFGFLYRTRLGNYHLLESPRRSRELSSDEARSIYRELPWRLVDESEAFRPAASEPDAARAGQNVGGRS